MGSSQEGTALSENITMRENPRLGFPLSEYQRRYDVVMTRLREAKLDAMLVKNPENICYLTGYETPGHYNYHGLLLSADEPVMVMRRFEEVNIEEFSWLSETVTIEDHEHPAEVAARLLAQKGLSDKRIGFEQGINKGGLYCSIDEHEVMRSALPKARFVDATKVVAGARVVKSDLEIAKMREAADIAEAAVEAGIGVIRPGGNENEIAAAVYHAAILRGSDYPSLPPFVLSGERTSLPHGTWRGRVLESGDPVYFEVSAIRYRYNAAVMRTVSVGEPRPEIESMANAMLEALDVGLDAIRPGVTGESVNDAIMAVVEKHGYGGEYFTHHAGYSIGLSFPPGWGEGHVMDIRRGEQQTLKPNMTFHVVPIALMYRQFGVGFSATVRVTETGCEPLTRRRSLEVCPV